MSKVDEDYVMGLIAGDVPAKKTTQPIQNMPPAPEIVNQPKERKIKPKGNEVKEYEEKYLRRIEMRDRQQIYIGGKTHQKFSKKIFAMKGRQFPLGALVECLINEHLEKYKDVIEQIENNRNKELEDD